MHDVKVTPDGFWVVTFISKQDIEAQSKRRQLRELLYKKAWCTHKVLLEYILEYLSTIKGYERFNKPIVHP